MYKGFIRPLLFLMNAEQAHHFTFKTLKVLFQMPGVKAITSLCFGSLQGKEKQVMGLHFKNPAGLAAGFAKDAKLYNELSAFGFGFIEVGTLTPKPQDGNPKPRLFRIVEDEAVINRMGFNNGGLDAAALRLAKKKTDIIIGGNIGKNKVTPNDIATSDYIKGVEALHDVVDYFVVNVSSPNTPNLRELQEKEPLKALLKEVKAKNEELGAKPWIDKSTSSSTRRFGYSCLKRRKNVCSHVHATSSVTPSRRRSSINSCRSAASSNASPARRMSRVKERSS